MDSNVGSLTIILLLSIPDFSKNNKKMQSIYSLYAFCSCFDVFIKSIVITSLSIRVHSSQYQYIYTYELFSLMLEKNYRYKCFFLVSILI